MTKPRNHWDDLARLLAHRGVRHVFGLPGDGLDAWHTFTAAGLRFHLVNDQRHGGYQAIASVAVRTQPFGVLVLGKGPAITHAATALLEAREQRLPLLVISSGTHPDLFGSRAFQELDATATTAPLTLAHATARTTADVLTMASELIDGFHTPGLGPVHLEIPEDLGERMTASHVPSDDGGIPETEVRATDQDDSSTGRAPTLSPDTTHPPSRSWRDALAAARKPGLLVGGGARGTDSRILNAIARRHGLVVLSTASGRGAYDETDEHFVGVSGLYLPDASRAVVNDIDLLLVLGSRLEETATLGWDLSTVSVIQVNINPSDLSGAVTGPTVIDTCDQMLAALQDTEPSHALDPQWRQRIRAVHDELMERRHMDSTSPIARFLRLLSQTLPSDTVSVHENGLQDIWSYSTDVWPITGTMTCLVPSEQTPLGFGVSAAVGAARVQRRPVIALVGDGALVSLGSELRHLRDLAAPLAIVVFNNGGFGWLQANLNSQRSTLQAARSADASTSGIFCGPVHSADAPFPDLVDGLTRAAGAELVSVDLRGPTALTSVIEQEGTLASIRSGMDLAKHSRRPLIVNVLVSLSDVPPGFEDLAGDVPQWAYPSTPVGETK